MDIRRFGDQYRSRGYALTRTYEVYSTYYDIVYPNHERRAGRPLRVPPAYTRHVGLGAELGEKSGWERVNWYWSNADRAHEDQRPRGWAGQLWSTAIVTEHLACRETAALFDESSFAKIEVTGPGAAAFLQGLCANDIDKRVGSITYTSMLNTRGGIECDFTVTRLEDERFLIVTGTAFGRHDLSWIQSHLPAAAPETGPVAVRDVTSAMACFGLWGPMARDILTDVCRDDLGFRYLSARPLTVGDVPCLGLRVTYVGELGWELYAPSEYGLRLWDALMEAGRPYGLVPGGYRAIDSLRLEKGYRVWGSDITSETDPFSAGLGFAVRLEKGPFVGWDAAAPLAPDGGRERLTCLVLDDPRSVTLGNEPVKDGSVVVGRVTSGGLGYSLGLSIAYAWLPTELTRPGTRLVVEVFGQSVGAEVRKDPLYDAGGDVRVGHRHCCSRRSPYPGANRLNSKPPSAIDAPGLPAISGDGEGLSSEATPRELKYRHVGTMLSQPGIKFAGSCLTPRGSFWSRGWGVGSGRVELPDLPASLVIAAGLRPIAHQPGEAGPHRQLDGRAACVPFLEHVAGSADQQHRQRVQDDGGSCARVSGGAGPLVGVLELHSVSNIHTAGIGGTVSPGGHRSGFWLASKERIRGGVGARPNSYSSNCVD
jgi:glycine cleavage system aminomethyltransferase T